MLLLKIIGVIGKVKNATSFYKIEIAHVLFVKMIKYEENMREKIEELERFKKVTVERELRMAELKKEIKDLKENNNSGG